MSSGPSSRSTDAAPLRLFGAGYVDGVGARLRALL